MANFTNYELVDYCRHMLGQRYWYGCIGYKCTQSLYEKKKKQFPNHYTAAREAQYKKDIENKMICTDCSGLIKSFFWTNGGKGVVESSGQDENYFTNKYASNGMPDYSANELFNWAKNKGADWGMMDNIPDIPGICVRHDGHVGVYVGDNTIIEAMGFNYGVVTSKLPSTRWTHWFALPILNYNANLNSNINDTALKLGDRTLKIGSSGQDVQELQQLLNQILNLSLVEDGKYGEKTKAAVNKLQAKLSVSMDGTYGSQTHNALMSYLSDLDPIIQEDTDTFSGPHFIVNQDNVNIYSGNDTKYSVLTKVNKGTTLIPIFAYNKEPILTINNWAAVQCENQIGWINIEFVK